MWRLHTSNFPDWIPLATSEATLELQLGEGNLFAYGQMPWNSFCALHFFHTRWLFCQAMIVSASSLLKGSSSSRRNQFTGWLNQSHFHLGICCSVKTKRSGIGFSYSFLLLPIIFDPVMTWLWPWLKLMHHFLKSKSIGQVIRRKSLMYDQLFNTRAIK